ncbi:hypothetical protein E0H35_35910 [Rhizobium leguminosarum bv. viciae]|uniref:Uncharacterized protein n=1 Tax=Rhizobium changzhiense TaxID=2692317 RepID=A0A7Z0RPK9_9HYPH|nr:MULTISPECIES: hypothetical protein [Rhizobium]ASS60435.1 hypothetical protein CHR56_38620 [Rhizobium leguminosarum bv. viciae]MBB4345641.1 hypothetical protein [Rhizobium leguminosarum]MBB5262326.1 hypothetical protein [Rhizobium leguminosarum]MBB6298713.1 hypothetical protein [Rhizobium leguminosarum]MBX5230268.1 hypothetical protein [Rhizobium sp. NLR9b]
MSDFNFLMLHAKLAGFKLLVSANRIGCEDEFSKMLHDRLMAGLDGAIRSTRHIMDLQRELVIGDDLEGTISCQLQGEEEVLARRTFVLLDELEIDYFTYEYRVNGGEWHNALSADCDGIEISYPTTVSVSDTEIGPLATIIHDIARETGIAISVARVVYA